MARYVRFQSAERSDRLGIHIGVFGLVNMLYNRSLLSDRDLRVRRARLDWFNRACTDPASVDPTVYQTGRNPGPVSWFDSAATHLVRGMREHCEILDRHGIAWERVESDDPGRALYEDEHQVVVVPYAEFSVASGGHMAAEDLDV